VKWFDTVVNLYGDIVVGWPKPHAVSRLPGGQETLSQGGAKSRFPAITRQRPGRDTSFMNTNSNLGRRLVSAALLTATLGLGGAAFGAGAIASAEPVLVVEDAQQPAPAEAQRTVATGQKMKIKGVVTRRDADTFTVRDMNGVDTVVTK
jgi:hypothetical protein